MLISFAKIQRMSTANCFKNLFFCNYENTPVLQRDPKLDMVFHFLFEANQENENFPFYNWDTIGLMQKNIEFIEKCVTYGEINNQELLMLLQKTNEFAENLLDFFQTITNVDNRVFKDYVFSFLKLKSDELFKLIFQVIRTFFALFRVLKKLTYYEFIRCFSILFHNTRYCQFYETFIPEINELFVFGLDTKTGKKNITRLFSDQIHDSMSIIKNKSYPILLQLYKLLSLNITKLYFSKCEKFEFGKHVNLKNSKESRKFIKKMTNENKNSMSSIIIDFEINKNLKFAYRTGNLRIIMFNDRDKKMNRYFFASKFLISSFIISLFKGFKLSKFMAKTYIYFGSVETKFIKAFDGDPFAFEFQILDFRRLIFQIQSLQKLLKKNKNQEQIDNLKSEMERMFEKIYLLFVKCESKKQRKKLQSVLINSSFYEELFRFLNLENYRNIQKIAKTEEKDNARVDPLMYLIIHLLEFFTMNNDLIRKIGHNYVFDLVELIENGLDVAVLLSQILRELENSEFNFLIERVYVIIQHRMRDFVSKKINDGLLKFNNRPNNKIQSVVVARKLSNQIKKRSLGKLNSK